MFATTWNSIEVFARTHVPADVQSRVLGYVDAATLRVTGLRDDAVSRATHLRDDAVSRATHLRDDAINRAVHLRDDAVSRASTLRAEAQTKYVAPTVDRVLKSRGGRFVPSFVVEKLQQQQQQAAAAADGDDATPVPPPLEDANGNTQQQGASLASSVISKVQQTLSKCTAANARAVTLDGISAVAQAVTSSGAVGKAVELEQRYVPASVRASCWSKFAAVSAFVAPYATMATERASSLDQTYAHGQVFCFFKDARVAVFPEQEQPQQQEEEDTTAAVAAEVVADAEPVEMEDVAAGDAAAADAAHDADA